MAPTEPATEISMANLIEIKLLLTKAQWQTGIEKLKPQPRLELTQEDIFLRSENSITKIRFQDHRVFSLIQYERNSEGGYLKTNFRKVDLRRCDKNLERILEKIIPSDRVLKKRISFNIFSSDIHFDLIEDVGYVFEAEVDRPEFSESIHILNSILDYFCFSSSDRARVPNYILKRIYNNIRRFKGYGYEIEFIEASDSEVLISGSSLYSNSREVSNLINKVKIISDSEFENLLESENLIYVSKTDIGDFLALRENSSEKNREITLALPSRLYDGGFLNLFRHTF